MVSSKACYHMDGFLLQEAIVFVDRGSDQSFKKEYLSSFPGEVVILNAQFSIIMGVWRQLAEYLYIKKRDPNAPHTKWMQYMHGINRISLIMFIIAIIIILLKLFVFRKS